MIRMGRGNRDQPGQSDYQELTPAAEPSYRYASETQAATARGAISESDSMARDIKEGRLSGFIGHGTTLTGETEFHAMLRVDGHLVGTVSSEAGTLIIGTNGQVDANIAVAAAMINGTVNGDVIATEKLQLGRTARVMGNIQSPRLIVEEGAILEGGCTMLKARETQEEQAGNAAAPYEEQPAPAALPDASDDAASYLATDDDEDEESAEAATV
ncbi:MAG TPA: polymer-forming cytoskeletal protein [Pyrinomonadaceae bacterium]|nr:polymer-forming cytoskeletal protein [Pyrinomonadaceae bacterium]